MQGISKLAMGSAMVVAVCLFLVFFFLLMLYAELCCAFLWQRRRRWSPQTPLPTTAVSGSGSAPSTKPQNKSQGDDEVATVARDGHNGGSPGSPLQKPAVSPTAAAYYAHGVLQTPASFFFTAVPRADAPVASTGQGELPRSKEWLLPSPKTSLHFIGLIPSPRSAAIRDDAVGGGCSPEEHFLCISNPIYEGAGCSTGAGDDDGGGSSTSTTFKTADSSPSRLEMDEEEGVEVLENGKGGSPPLKPMKKLPPALPLGMAAAFLVDGRRSLATSISATDTNRPSSSSSSNSLGTSPSW